MGTSRPPVRSNYGVVQVVRGGGDNFSEGWLIFGTAGNKHLADLGTRTFFGRPGVILSRSGFGAPAACGAKRHWRWWW